MTRYAESTTVPAEKSRMEIEATLRRYGADSFLYGYDATQAVVGFVANGRQIRFVITMPEPTDKRFTHFKRSQYGDWVARTDTAAREQYEQACRQRWRALALVIKAKLEAVAAGITEFEDEFLAHIVLPDGSSVSQFMRPQIARAYEIGAMPSMLPALGPGAGS